MSGIIPFNRGEAIGPRCRRLFQEWRAASNRWFDKTMELAEALLAARTECGGDDIRFARWLIENDLEDLHPKTRTALIGMAMHPEVSAGMLRISGRQSVRYIWEEEIKPYLAGDPRTAIAYIWEEKIKPLVEPNSAAAMPLHDSTEGLIGIQADNVTNGVAPEETQENQGDPPVLTNQTEGPSAEPAPRPPPLEPVKVTSRSGYFGLPRAEEILALFPTENARVALSTALRAGTAVAQKEIWSMILTCADAGLLRRTDYAPATASGKLLLRFLLSDIPATLSREYDLTVPAARKEVKTVILPAILDQKDAFLKEPAALKRLINTWKIKQSQARAATLVAQPNVHTPPVIAPPDSRPVIVMYGVQLWPIVDNHLGDYSYDQLRSAIWSFQQLDRWLAMTNDNSPKSRAIMIRFSTRFYSAYAERALDKDSGWRMRGVFQLVHTLATLLETAPDGVCTPPVAPHGTLGWD